MNYKKDKLFHHLKFKSTILSAVLFFTMLFNTAIVGADDIQAKEYFLKTAFLYNFARLVDWPSNTFKTAASPMKLCFMGNDSFADALTSIRNKKANSRSLIIKRNIALNEVLHCHILFISQSETNNLHNILHITAQLPILTVSEIPGFTQKNGHIRFFLRNDNTLSLEINLEAVNKSHLTISSRILSLAKIITSYEVSKP